MGAFFDRCFLKNCIFDFQPPPTGCTVYRERETALYLLSTAMFPSVKTPDFPNEISQSQNVSIRCLLLRRWVNTRFKVTKVYRNQRGLRILWTRQNAHQLL